MFFRLGWIGKRFKGKHVEDLGFKRLFWKVDKGPGIIMSGKSFEEVK